MTHIAVLGTGHVGAALATALAGAGHSITVGSRDPGRAAGDWAGPPPRFAGPDQAAGAADLVVNALPGAVAVEVLAGLRDALRGKVLIDVANAVHTGPDGFAESLMYPGSSLAHRLQTELPQTRVVKALHTMGPAEVMTAPASVTPPATAFLSGDDPGAKRDTAALLADLGWSADWIVDLGDVTTAQATEAFILLVGPLARTWGMERLALTVAR